MRFRLALLLGAAFIIGGVVVMLPTDDGDVTAGSTSTSLSDSTTTTEPGATTTSGSDGDTTTSEAEGTTTTSEAGETTTTTSGDTTTTTGETTSTTGQETTTTTAAGDDVTGPTVTNIVISDDDLTEWCEGDPEAGSTMTISLEAADPSGVEGVFVSWLVDLSDGFADLVLDGDTWEAEILFESGTIFDIIEPQQIDMTIVAEDTEGNFTFVDRFGPTLTPKECS